MLPKISYPIHDFSLVDGTKEKFRPYTVREEKLFLMAKASQEVAETDGARRAEMLSAIKQVIRNCSLRDGFDVDTLSVLDVEWLFLQLRAASVEEVISVTYEDPQDGRPYTFEVKIKDIKIKRTTPEPSSKISITDVSGLEMRPPPASIYGDPKLSEMTEEAATYEVIKHCISSIWVDETTHTREGISDDELDEFVESLDMKTITRMREYLENIPRLEYVIKYKNSLGEDREIILNTLADFFSLG